jgi:DMSO/TMAO reductase YedYZ heme-binding membrane subunit
MATLLPDKYIDFDLINLFIPFTNSYKPLAVSLGVLGFWTLVAIQGTSLMMKKMSRQTWRRIHMLSYPLYGIIVVHSLTAGSDVGTQLYTGFTMALAMTGAAVAGIRLVTGRFIDRKKRENAAR